MSIVDSLKNDIESKSKELERLKQALALLEGYQGSSEETPLTPPEPKAPAPSTSPSPTPPKPKGVICSACDGIMYRTYKRVPSGVTVEYWQCSNTGCNNEMY